MPPRVCDVWNGAFSVRIYVRAVKGQTCRGCPEVAFSFGRPTWVIPTRAIQQYGSANEKRIV